MKSLAWFVGIGVGLTIVSPAFGKEKLALSYSISEATPWHFLVAQTLGQTGKVNWYNAAKGFGYITPDDGSQDVYVDASAYAATGFKTLVPGQRVIFDVKFGPKGPTASNVKDL